jgi:hypothetical protein
LDFAKKDWVALTFDPISVHAAYSFASLVNQVPERGAIWAGSSRRLRRQYENLLDDLVDKINEEDGEPETRVVIEDLKTRMKPKELTDPRTNGVFLYTCVDAVSGTDDSWIEVTLYRRGRLGTQSGSEPNASPVGWYESAPLYRFHSFIKRYEIVRPWFYPGVAGSVRNSLYGHEHVSPGLSFPYVTSITLARNLTVERVEGNRGISDVVNDLSCASEAESSRRRCRYLTNPVRFCFPAIRVIPHSIRKVTVKHGITSVPGRVHAMCTVDPGADPVAQRATSVEHLCQLISGNGAGGQGSE